MTTLEKLHEDPNQGFAICCLLSLHTNQHKQTAKNFVLHHKGHLVLNGTDLIIDCHPIIVDPSNMDKSIPICDIEGNIICLYLSQKDARDTNSIDDFNVIVKDLEDDLDSTTKSTGGKGGEWIKNLKVCGYTCNPDMVGMFAHSVITKEANESNGDSLRPYLCQNAASLQK